jgi:hypothetical protein
MKLVSGLSCTLSLTRAYVITDVDELGARFNEL